jgi:hypothetical protein
MTDDQDDPLRAAIYELGEASPETTSQVFNGLLVAFLGIIYALRKEKAWSKKTDATFIATMEKILSSDSLAPVERAIVERVKEEVAELEYPAEERRSGPSGTR